jgi:predicted RNase H-like HicB family nuclease
MEKLRSTNPLDYDILIRRRGEHDYAAYCPQLAYMVKGSSHEEVEERMRQYIQQWIEQLQREESASAQQVRSAEEQWTTEGGAPGSSNAS